MEFKSLIVSHCIYYCINISFWQIPLDVWHWLFPVFYCAPSDCGPSLLLDTVFRGVAYSLMGS